MILLMPHLIYVELILLTICNAAISKLVVLEPNELKGVEVMCVQSYKYPYSTPIQNLTFEISTVPYGKLQSKEYSNRGVITKYSLSGDFTSHFSR